MTEQQIAALMARIDARVDARVDTQIASKVGNIENITPIAFEQKWMQGYSSTMPIDQALFRCFLRSISTSDIIGKNFKTIGGAVATTKEDTLTLNGTNGITITTNGKTITLDASAVRQIALKLYEFENQEVAEAKVKNLFEKFDGTSVADKYFEEFASTMNDEERVTYWNDILSTCRTEISTYGMCSVPYNSSTICNIYPKSIANHVQGSSHSAIVEVVGKGLFLSVTENYISNNPPIVDKAKIDSSFVLTIGNIAAMIINHENRILALEGN